MMESLRCGVHHGGSDGYNPCKFPCQCVCRLYYVWDDLERAVEDLFAHARMVHGMLSVFHLNRDGLVGRASRSVDKHFFLSTFIEFGNVRISMIDGAKLALDHMDALFSGDDFESEIILEVSSQTTLTGRVVPQPCAAYPLYPIDFNQPWRQFLDNDELVMFVM